MFKAYPFLLAPSTALNIALLLDLGVSGLSDWAGADRFSVDFLSVACDQKHQQTVNTFTIYPTLLHLTYCTHRPLYKEHLSQFWAHQWSGSPVGLLRIVCLITSLLSTPCSKRLDRSSRNHSPVTTFSSLQTHSPPLTGNSTPQNTRSTHINVKSLEKKTHC